MTHNPHFKVTLIFVMSVMVHVKRVISDVFKLFRNVFRVIIVFFCFLPARLLPTFDKCFDS